MISIVDRFKYTYWRLVPYDWRPMEIWYRLKCWAWHRHTTVKSRYLGHTWCDRCELMPYTMFEILAQFLKEECSPGCIEWYGEYGHKINVDGVEKYVMAEMKDLDAWWRESWNKEYNNVRDILWAEARKHAPTSEDEELPNGNFLYRPQYKTKEDEEIYVRCMLAINKLDRIKEEALQERLHRLIPLIPYMWT